MESFEEGYSYVAKNIGGVMGTVESVQYVTNVQSTVDEALDTLRREAYHRINVSDDYLKGWLAEQWHSETFKVSASARGRSDIWAVVPGDNKAGDIRYGDATTSYEAQIKYMKNGTVTAKAISNPKYDAMGKVVPSDQLDDVRAAAGSKAEEISMSRPEQASQYKDTANRATGQIQVGDVASKPLSEPEAKQMAKDFHKEGDIDADKYGLNTESFVEWTDIARQSGKAALHAAIMSSAITAAPHIWAVTREYIKSGRIDPDDLLQRGQAVFMGAGSAGLRGGVAAGLTVACKSGLMGEVLKGVSPAAIGMATTLSLNAINYSLQLHQGRIDRPTFARLCLRDTAVLATGMFGATVGQMIIPIPVFGALAGSIVGATVGAVAFEGANQVMLGVCVESGWTFLGMVKQDYEVPEEVLRQVGYDLFSARSFTTKSFSMDGFTINSFRSSSLSFTPIRRGVISCNVIGYV